MATPMKNLFAPAGKAALITGGTSGIGRAVAECFLQNGIDVAVCSRHPETAGDLAELAAAEGRSFVSMYCDVTDDASVDTMMDEAEAVLGPITLVVNSAGMNILKPAEDYDAASFTKVIDLNVNAMHRVSSKAAKRWMIPAGKGRIVNISSAKGFLAADRNYTAYCASKGGVNMYTQALGAELARFGITVNAIAPTFVRSPINEKQLSDPVFYNKIVSHIPVGRLGTGKDMAAAILFLCSEGAEFITGVTLKVDGGCTSIQ